MKNLASQLNIFAWTRAQWDAAGRHLLNIAGTVGALLIALKVVAPAMLASVTPETVTFWTGQGAIIFGALSAVFLALAPIYSMLQAAMSASPESQAEQTVKNLESGVPLNGKKDQLIAAVADQPEVAKIDMVSKAKADEILSDKVQ